jgi:hypothetical protein
MTETIRVNLDKTYAGVKVVAFVAGALIACFQVYASVDKRMDNIEQEQAVTKGVQQEWMRSMENNVERIYDIVKEWERE